MHKSAHQAVQEHTLADLLRCPSGRVCSVQNFNCGLVSPPFVNVCGFLATKLLTMQFRCLSARQDTLGG